MAWYETQQKELDITHETIAEVERALARLKTWAAAQEQEKANSQGLVCYWPERAAARRSTLDATKALAKFRKPL